MKPAPLFSSVHGLKEAARATFSVFPQSVTILGSTGSIGQSALDIIRQHKKQFHVEALTANNNLSLLIEQARYFRPSYVAIANEALYPDLKEALKGSNIQLGAGESAVIEAACRPADRFVSAIVGIAGLKPTWAALENGTLLALANKESLVCAGELMVSHIQKYGATLLPVDSEHSAIFQTIEPQNTHLIQSIILTASGGPFRTLSRQEMRFVTPQQALAHPNWSMGSKISIDSASMMNKGLEFIEAFYLFPVEVSQIEIVIHPQSILHGAVTYTEGTMLAHMGWPDMRAPISWALSWPSRIPLAVRNFRLTDMSDLTFFAPDMDRFPMLSLAQEALRTGGNIPLVMNAANEVAVESFLAKKICFTDMASVIAHTMETVEISPVESLDHIFYEDACARKVATAFIKRLL